jgi:hypothetical protein
VSAAPLSAPLVAARWYPLGFSTRTALLVRCPHCGARHVHGVAEQLQPHCDEVNSPRGYVVKEIAA